MASPREELLVLLRGLNLGAMASAVEDTALRAAKEGLSHEAFLLELARTERAAKSARRVERLRHHSGLLPGKNFRTLDLNRFAPAARMQVERLRDGSFLTEAINVVAIGRPGAGKSHLVSALDHQRVDAAAPGSQARSAPPAGTRQA
jgi:DNA replication protein DnaC